MKKDLDPAHAREIAQDFLMKTSSLYSRAEIAGSLRRREYVVHDVDIAIIPSDENRSRWKAKLASVVESIGGRVISSGELIVDIDYREVQLNLFLGRNETWGSTLMWATGPKGHTIGMTIKAEKKNLLFNSTGIWTRTDPPRLVGGKSEEEIGAILGWKYKPPELRGLRKPRSEY